MTRLSFLSFSLIARGFAIATCLAALACGGTGNTPAPAPSPTPAATAADACPPVGDVHFVCGIQSPEDLVRVGDTPWLIASGMVAGSGLHAVDTTAKTTMPLFTSAVARSAPDATRFSHCPGPLDPNVAVLHGLAIRSATSTGHYTLYATNHGGRQSVEVFDLDTTGSAPAATWTGCVTMPDGLEANSVAAFSDGTLLTTVVMRPGFTFEDMFAGKNTGAVYQWTPGADAFTLLPGAETPGNNGIDTAPDDREFYVASSGAKRVTAFSRTNPARALRVAQLKEFAPDNVRLVGGQLVAAGMIDDEPSCGGAPKKAADIQCPRGYIAVQVDPKTMAITELVRGPVAAPYTGTATAIQVGTEVWLSSFNTDRIAYRTLTR